MIKVRICFRYIDVSPLRPTNKNECLHYPSYLPTLCWATCHVDVFLILSDFSVLHFASSLLGRDTLFTLLWLWHTIQGPFRHGKSPHSAKLSIPHTRLPIYINAFLPHWSRARLSCARLSPFVDSHLLSLRLQHTVLASTPPLPSIHKHTHLLSSI